MTCFCVYIYTLLAIVDASGKSLCGAEVSPLKSTNFTIKSYVVKSEENFTNNIINDDERELFKYDENILAENFNDFHGKNKQNVGQPCGNCTLMVSNLTIVINSTSAALNKSRKR